MKNKRMNKKQKEEWAKVRAKGRKRYILIMGGAFAILMFVITQFIGLLRAYWSNTPYVLIDSTPDVLVEIIGDVIFGWLMGVMIWSAKESAYRQPEDE
jgi:hypothetical protein